jgi:hypothetical protein
MANDIDDDDPMDDFDLDAADGEEANERERGDDDGTEYAHPDDERDERLHDGFND